jgi:hyperosmotically inducible protein
MKTKILIACIVAGTLLPIAGYTADGDSDRSSPKTFFIDSVTTAKIKEKLAEEKFSTLVRISVDTDNKGMVYLSGTAKTQVAADRAVVIARGIKGGNSVQSSIQVKADN